MSRGWRKKALKILFVFVSKGHVFGSKVVDFLTRRFGNLEVFVMAVGAGIGIDSAVQKWASRPFELHFIRANNYYALKKEFSVIKYKGVNKRCDLQTRDYYDECARLCVCEDGKSTHCYRVRKEFTAMPLEERIRFIETIKQANLDPKYREEFSRLTDIHSEQFFHGVHERDFFLPWHRWYLFEFENFLRQIDCRVTIPYWDWAQVAKTFWRESHERDIWNSGPHGLGGNGRLTEDYCVMAGPFRKGHWHQSKNSGSGCLKRRFKYDKQPRNTTDIRKTVDSSFKVFEHNVRKVFHNELHCLIGGTMGNITSSQSPEFWLHHAFLDQIWVQYQRRGDQQRNEYYPHVNGTLPGCRIKWRPGNFVQETNLPGCVRILYKENKDHKGDQMDAKTESYYNESIKYKETVCFHDRKIE